VEPHGVTCLRSLAGRKLEAKHLDQVILVGGQTRMGPLAARGGEWFGCEEFEETRANSAARTIIGAKARNSTRRRS